MRLRCLTTEESLCSPTDVRNAGVLRDDEPTPFVDAVTDSYECIRTNAKKKRRAYNPYMSKGKIRTTSGVYGVFLYN